MSDKAHKLPTREQAAPRAPRPRLRVRLRALARRIYAWRYYVPLTPLGVMVLVSALFVHFAIAPNEVDFVLHSASLVALGVLAFAVALVIIVSLLLWLRLRGSSSAAEWDRGGALELESGARCVTGYNFPRFRIWPMVQVTPSWAAPADVDVAMEKQPRAAGGGLSEVAEPRSRGRHPTLVRRFIVADIFGLARLGVRRTSARPVRISPSRARIGGHVIAHFIGGDALSHPAGPTDGEMLDMRRYAHGDPMRRIIWKAFARSRQLLVRTPERAVMPSPSAVAYLVAGPGDEPTASAARFFVEEGLLGKDFLFQADGANTPTQREDEALEQIIDSAAFRDMGGEGLGRFIAGVEERRRSAFVLFVPPVMGRWLEHVEMASRRLSGATVVLAVDHEASAKRRGVLRRLFFSSPAAGAQELSAHKLPELVRRLGKAGYDVRVLHRPSGQLVPTTSLEALAR
ncbi:MAG: DUF58 domain-containing protein [Myxococcales bacterium]|nr:DUF58 domain-containing protein [Myxococcales bacterium]